MRKWTFAVGGAALALAALASPAWAIDPEDIVKALQAKPKPQATRSFRPAAAPQSRGIAIEGGEDKPEPAPSIDLYVHFEYDKAALTMSDAIITIDALGKALKDPRLADLSFRIIGHTDGRGNDDYNNKLSRDRAEAVRQRLIQYNHVDAGKLTAEGRGKRELKDPSRPEDAINRRVQIVSISGTS